MQLVTAAYSTGGITPAFTVRGKILEGENFGESLLMKQMARKILANLLAGLQSFHCIYNYWRRKFWRIVHIRQIRQNFPPPNFSHVRYTGF